MYGYDIDHAWAHNELWFEVKWGLGDTTWEPLDHCNNLVHLDKYLMLQNVREPKNLLSDNGNTG
jgi:hypothetical protein